MSYELDADLKQEYITLIKKCSKAKNGIKLSNREITMLYHWIRNMDDPMYNFVPEEYKKELSSYTGGQK